MGIDERDVKQRAAEMGAKGILKSLLSPAGKLKISADGRHTKKFVRPRGRFDRVSDILPYFIGISFIAVMVFSVLWLLWTLFTEGNKTVGVFTRGEVPNASQVEIVYRSSSSASEHIAPPPPFNSANAK